jgi:drug/metabolite transporter (DMT)-like permease
VYGGTTSGGGDTSSEVSAVAPSIKPSAPLVGDLLTLFASITYGLYQVLYKRYAALPSDPSELYNQVPSEEPAIGSLSETPSSTELITLPFGLHANLLTSIIGLLTLVVVWIFIPICHYLNLEPFMLPANLTTCLVIAGISLSGVIFNAGFMVSILPSWVHWDAIIDLLHRLDSFGHVGSHCNICWKSSHNCSNFLNGCQLVSALCYDSIG